MMVIYANENTEIKERERCYQKEHGLWYQEYVKEAAAGDNNQAHHDVD